MMSASPAGAVAQDGPAALRVRLSSATTNDVLLGMFTEMLLRRTARLFGAERAQLTRTLFLGGRRLSRFFRYPVAETLNVLHDSASRAEDYAGFIQASGEEAVDVFFDSPIGRAMALLGEPDPHRLLASTPAGYRACVSWGERRYRRVGTTEAVVEFRSDLLGPAWQMGTFHRGLLRACGVDARIELESHDDAGMDFDLRARW